MRRSAIKHTTIRNSNLFCINCGGEYVIKYPLPITGVGSFSELVKGFNLLHGACKPTWVEPKADQQKSVNEKAMWWLNNGHVGQSSKTMWNCFMGNTKFPVNHPYDPDDFSRCYKLLEAVPEWKNDLSKLKPLSKAWSNLVDNWDKLTEMYELNEKQEWKKYKEIGMYEFMGTLIE